MRCVSPLLFIVLLAVPAFADDEDKARDHAARLVVARMAKADFEHAVEPFDKAMINASPPDKLVEYSITWDWSFCAPGSGCSALPR